jgi:hypothetical protein
METPDTSRKRSANRSRTIAESSAINTLKGGPISFIAAILRGSLLLAQLEEFHNRRQNDRQSMSEEFGQRGRAVTD